MKNKITEVILFLILATFFAVSSAGAEAVSGLTNDYLRQLGNEERAVFDSDGMVFRYDEEKRGPVYLPESGFSGEIMDLHKALSPDVMVEALYYIGYPPEFPGDIEGILSELNRLIHRISTISGAMYFSRTEQDYAVLFKDVYVVDGPDGRKPMADPEVLGAPVDGTEYLHMDEHSMGRGYYRLDYRSKAEELALILTNTTSMSKIIKAVNPEEMKIFLQLIPCEDGLLVYGYCGVVLQNDALINLMMDPYYSFYRRMTAMETWLYNILHNSERLPPLSEPMP